MGLLLLTYSAEYSSSNVVCVQDFPVVVKWPNDVYYQGLVKLGGVIVTSFSGGSSSTPTTAIVG